MLPGHRRSLLNSLRQLVNTDDPFALSFVEMLKDKEFERARKFRVGGYRVFFTINTDEIIYQKHTYKGTIVILSIRKRSEAY
jgi:mRNA-degrading endonuclease RelE of RelBE toxin-antitoxin system